MRKLLLAPSLLLSLLGSSACTTAPSIESPAAVTTPAAAETPAPAPPASSDDTAGVSAPAAEPPAPSAQQRLAAIIDLLKAEQVEPAQQALQALRQDHPDDRLAQRLDKELQAALAAGPRIGSLKLLAEQTRLRLASEQAVPTPGLVPDAILALDPAIEHVVVVDLSNARLYLLQNGEQGLQLVRSHYAAMGSNGWGKQLAGDRRTPLGVYRPQKWLDGKGLPPLFGAGAFTLDYPNAWDRYRQRGGGGIWLHGVPRDLDSRPPRSSEGCVTMGNADLLALKPSIAPGITPVILSDHVQWLSAKAQAGERERFLQRLQDWQQAWTSIDTERYLSFYAEDFSTADMDRAAFVAYKQRVNAQKASIDVTIDGLSVFRYPGEEAPMLLAEFTQHYRSDNFSSDTRKQQFWRQDSDGSWKIVREETP